MKFLKKLAFNMTIAYALAFLAVSAANAGVLKFSAQESKKGLSKSYSALKSFGHAAKKVLY